MTATSVDIPERGRPAHPTHDEETMTEPDTSSTAPTMQEVILRLQAFWAKRGVLLQQPFNTEVGAGTANPATALRVLAQSRGTWPM